MIKAIATSLAALVLSASLAVAQDFPTRPITWVIPYPPGGNPDVIARFVAKAVGDKLGQPVLVDNRTGAAGIVGTEFVAASKPDGYTIVYASSSMMTVIPLINKKLSFAPLNDFTPVHGLGLYDMVLVTNSSRPFDNVAALIAYAKANPKKLNYGSAGVGTTAHLATAFFEKLAGVEMTHIPFRGAGQSVPSLLANDIDLLFDYPASTKELIAAGKLKALAATGATRMSSLPDVPTLQEAGFADGVFNTWDIILAPAGVPVAVKDKLAGAFREVLAAPETVAFFADRGAKPSADLSGKKLIDFIDAEAAKMKAIVDRTGVVAE